MASVIDRRPGGGGGAAVNTKYVDEGDGSYPEASSAQLRIWDATDGAWNKAVVDHATGALKVYLAGGSGAASTIADGADVVEGATTDAAVVTNTTGTISGKLRGLVAWAYTKMPASLGSTTSAGSLPVVVASDQVAVATKAADGVNVALGTTTDAAASATGSLIAQVRKAKDVLVAGLPATVSSRVPVDPSGVTSPVSIATAPVLVAGTAEIGRVGLSKTGTGFTGYLLATLTSVATVSGSAGKLAGGSVINLNSVPVYLQVFDTTGAVSLGTTVPTITIPIPANATAANGVASNLGAALGDVGLAIANGIKIAATTGPKNITTVTTGLEGFLLYA